MVALMFTITQATVHMPLYCIYSETGYLVAAFPALADAEAYAENVECVLADDAEVRRG